MNGHFYGRCDTCAAKLSSRYYSLYRQVERQQHVPKNDPAEPTIFNHILQSEQLTQYCVVDCAQVGVYCQLNDRGIPLGTVGPGPIAPCSKCGKPMDLTQVHVAYELMDQTEIRQPWLISIDPHDSQTVARVCQNCDGDLPVCLFDVAADQHAERLNEALVMDSASEKTAQ